MPLGNGLNGMKSVQYSFEEIKGSSRYDMADQFGNDGVKAYLYEKKLSNASQDPKDAKEYQQRILAQHAGFSSYREMGEALKDGKVPKSKILQSFRELENQGLIDSANFIDEKKDSLKDKANSISKYGKSNSTVTTRKDIQQKFLKNELDAYAEDEGYFNKNDEPDGLLFLQAVDSGDYRSSKAKSLVERYRDSFDSVGYAGSDYTDYRNSKGLVQGEYTIDDISDRIVKRF